MSHLILCLSSVQFSHSVMSDSLQPHELWQARPPCPSLTPGIYSNSCPLSLWCHPIISPSVIPFFSCLQSFPESGSFPVSQIFASGGQSIGASASVSVLPMNIQDWFPLGLTGLNQYFLFLKYFINKLSVWFPLENIAWYPAYVREWRASLRSYSNYVSNNS